MKLTTSKGKEYLINWVETSEIAKGALMLQMHDERDLAVIVKEFDGLDWLNREDEKQGDKLFEGYTILIGVQRQTPGTVLLSLAKP